MQKLFFHIAFVFCLLPQLNTLAQVRSEIDFNNGWKFYPGDDSLAKEPSYNDSKWRKISLPHDWSIESDFKKDFPATTQGGALPGGIGWYRKTFTLPSSAANKNVSIEFDGVYKNSEVWINGHYLGKRPNGYVAFSYDLTEYILPSPQKNVIVVKVDNSQQPDSRWYSGSGIYRNVKLIYHHHSYIDAKSIFISTNLIDPSHAIINLSGLIKNISLNFPTRIRIFNNSGKIITDIISVANLGEIQAKIKITLPQLWSIENPY